MTTQIVLLPQNKPAEKGNLTQTEVTQETIAEIDMAPPCSVLQVYNSTHTDNNV